MKFNIRYNPYNNEIHFQENGCEMQDGSSFLKYQKRKIIMQNCIEDIIELINIYENISMEGVNISFEGTNEDYSILCDAIKKDKNPKSQRIKTEHTKRIISSSDAIKIIRDSDVRVHLPEGLIASGIPQVENEILYFAKTYADYKKSVNGRMLLLNALELADSELRRKKQELVDDKKLQKEEQDKKRQEIEQSINNVSCEFVNVVIDSTQKKYRSILSSFLEDAKQDARNYWLTVMNEKHAKDMLISHMNKFGQSELYGKNCKEIDEVVRRKYLDICIVVFIVLLVIGLLILRD